MEAGAGAGGSAGGNPFGGFGGFETHYYVSPTPCMPSRAWLKQCGSAGLVSDEQLAPQALGCLLDIPMLSKSVKTQDMHTCSGIRSHPVDP